MNIRLVEAAKNDFDIYKTFYQNCNYHWFFGNRNRVERREALKRPPRSFKVKFNSKGKRMYTASERRKMYNEEQFKNLLLNVKKTIGSCLYIIYNKNNKAIGYILCRIECKKKRIVEFPLAPDYQRYQVIEEVLKKLNQKTKNKKQYTILVVNEFGAQLLKKIPEIEISINNEET